MTPRIYAISISHKTASLAVREQLSLDDDRAVALLREMARTHGEAVLVRTCGRMELYVASSSGWDVPSSFAKALGVRLAQLRSLSHVLDETHATAHLLEVAAGLHSPLPGEHHILGQVRDALLFAQEAKTAGPLLSALFRAAIHSGKRVRNETPIGRLAQTYASAALDALRERLSPASHVLVVGSGTLANEMAQGLAADGVPDITITSRHRARGQQLAESIHGTWFGLDRIAELLQRSDVVICCTSSRTPLIKPHDVSRDGQYRIFVDLGMPRNIDAEVEELPGATVINLDDLTHGKAIAGDCIAQARDILSEERRRFDDWLTRRRAYYAGRTANGSRAIRSEAAA